jgi:Flp pilus assembly protein TadG
MSIHHLNTGFRYLSQLVRRLRAEDGVAAIEFALIGGFASISMLNATDLAIYARDRLEVDNATEMGAQAAWKTCDTKHLPATKNCANLSSAVKTAVQSSSLGANVTLQNGSPAEGYYCVNSSGVLTYVADVNNKPADCSSVGMAGNSPGDYIKVQTTFTYAPLFPASVAKTLGTTITKTAWMRLG